MSLGTRGTVSEMNVVPLIDSLLVLLVIFMIIPNHQKGLDVVLPQPAPQSRDIVPQPAIVVVQVLGDGSLKLNQEPVAWENLNNRLAEVFKVRADRTAFIRGDGPVEFAVVAKVIDVLHAQGVSPVGLLTPGLEASH